MVTRRRGSAVAVGVALVLGGLATQGISGAARAEIPEERGIPVLGQAYVSALGQGEERPPTMVVTVHGVRRLAEATVIYYSVGFQDEAPDPEVLPVTEYGTGPETYGTLQASSGADFMSTAAIIDVPGKKAYAALRAGAGRAVTSPPPIAPEDRVRMSDRAVAQWIALAPIPAKLTVVDVLIGSAFFTGITVGNGPLEPVSEVASPSVGQGWPRVDTIAIAKASAEGTTATLVPHIVARPVATTPPTATPSATAAPTKAPTKAPTPPATPSKTTAPKVSP